MAGEHGPVTGRRGWRRRGLVAATVVATAAAVWAPTAARADGPNDHEPAPTIPARDAREIPLPGVLALPPTGFMQPESVAYDEKAKAFYTAEQVGGAVAKVFLDKRAPQVLVPRGTGGQVAAAGVLLDEKRRLYVAGGADGTLRIFNPDSGKLVGALRTGVVGGFLNDVTVTKKGDVYGTDSFRPSIYRWTAKQVEAGSGTPEVIPLNPEVAGGPGPGSTSVKTFNANGIRETPDGRYILFNDLNDAALYRLTPPAPGKPTAREIKKVAVAGGSLGDSDGLEFVGGTLYAADNGGERILKLTPSKDFLAATIESATVSPLFNTPTAAAKGPGDTLLVPNSELFTGLVPPFFVDSIKRP